jgi:hypothetical protein
MAKQRKQPSLAAMFKRYFTEHPEWLQEEGGNAKAIELFEKENPGHVVGPQVRQAMYNVKSAMKKGPAGAAKRNAKKRAARDMVVAARVNSRPRAPLNALEEQIDDCMILAKQIDRERLGRVLDHLHRARNAVVVMLEG